MNRRTRLPLGTLMVLCLGLLLVEASWLGLYHEEPRRLLVAVSMLSENQWFVPHILGEVYLRKPPGFNWSVALFSLPFGGVTPGSARLVSLVSWLVVGGLTYGLTLGFRRWQARVTAALASMFSLVFFVEKAALAELDLFFTAVVLAALVVWFRGRGANRPRWAWLLSHALLGLALLTKGPVAYLFFYPPVLAVLWRRDDPVDWAGFGAGLLLAHALVGGWLLEVVREISYERFASVVLAETVSRGGQPPAEYLGELVTYPLKAIGSFLPWSLLGLPLLNRSVRRSTLERLRTTRRGDLLLGAAVSACFLWFFPVDRSRYLMPLFPLGGLFLGILVESAPDLDGVVTRWGRRCCWGLGALLGAMVALPWILEVEGGTLSFWTVLTGGFWMALGGMILVGYLVETPGYESVLVGLVLFCFVVKAGYLFVFVPVEDPQRLNSESRIKATLLGMDLPRDARIGYGTDTSLEIPFYMLELGYPVRVETNLERLRSYPYYVLDRSGEPRPILGRFDLREHRDQYLYGPRRTGRTAPDDPAGEAGPRARLEPW